MFSWNLGKSFRNNWNCAYPLQHSIIPGQYSISTWPYLNWNIFYFSKKKLDRKNLLFLITHCPNPNDTYLLKVSKKNAWRRCEICSKLTIKTPERRQWYLSVVFIVFTVNIFPTLFYVFMFNFEHLIAGWDSKAAKTNRQNGLSQNHIFHSFTVPLWIWSELRNQIIT